MSILILKYTAEHWIYPALQNWKEYFFYRFFSALKLVYFSDLLGFKHANILKHFITGKLIFGNKMANNTLEMSSFLQYG